MNVEPLMPNKGGRPALNKTRHGTAPVVSVRLSDVTYDELYELHRETGKDISTLIREAIEARLLSERRLQQRFCISKPSTAKT